MDCLFMNYFAYILFRILYLFMNEITCHFPLLTALSAFGIQVTLTPIREFLFICPLGQFGLE